MSVPVGASARRLSDEAARWRRSLREEQERHETTRRVLQHANRQLLGVFLRERLADPGDFHVYVGAAAVTDSRGAIVWERVDRLLEELLAVKPHLATPGTSHPLSPGVSAVSFFLAET